MRLLQTLLLAVAAGLSACQSGPAETGATRVDLAPLTLAELHREGPRSYNRCRQVSGSGWRCENRSDYVMSVVQAPPEVAPFMAQIYLHPEFTTEEDLIAQGAQGLPLWSVRHICGGALVAPNWVATAAHCFPDPRLDTKYGVRIGLSDIVEESGTLYRVEEVVRRDPNAPTRQNDVALVRFALNEEEPTALSQSAFTRFAGAAPPVTAAITDLRDQLLLALDGNGWLRLIDLRDGTRTRSAPYSVGLEILTDENVILSWGPDKISLTPIGPGGDPLIIPFAEVSALARSEDGEQLVAYASMTGEVAAFSPQTGAVRMTASAPARLREVHLVADSSRVLVTALGREARLFDLATGAPVPLNIPATAPFIGLYANASRLVFQDRDNGELFLLDARTGRVLASRITAPAAFSGGTVSATYLPTWAGSGAPLTIYDGATLDTAAILGFGGQDGVGFWEWTRDGQRLILWSEDRRGLQVYDLAERRMTQNVYFAPGEEITGIEQTENASTLIITTSIEAGVMPDGFVQGDRITYSLTSDNQLAQLRRLTAAQLNQGAADRLIWTMLPDGQIVGTANGEGRSFIWAIAACPAPVQTCTPSGQMDHSVPVSSVQFVDGLGDLLVLAENGTVQLWTPQTLTERLRIFHGGLPLGATWDARSNRLLTYGENGFLRAWDIATQTEVQRIDFARFADSVDDGIVIMPDEVTPDMSTAAPQTTYLKLDDGNSGLQDGTPVRVFGWGRYNVGNTARRSHALREAGLRVLSPASCRAPEFWDGHADIHDRVFCAQDIERKTCVGDSGGPVVIGSDLASLLLVGVASWGSQACEADGKPGVYTRISSHTDWILSVIGNDLPSESGIGGE